MYKTFLVEILLFNVYIQIQNNINYKKYITHIMQK
jgi:hypothetical protein